MGLRLSGSHFSVVQQRKAVYEGTFNASKKRTPKPIQEKRGEKEKATRGECNAKIKTEKEAKTTEKKRHA